MERRREALMDLGFRVLGYKGLGFRVLGLGCRVLGFRVVGFRVVGFRVNPSPEVTKPCRVYRGVP